MAVKQKKKRDGDPLMFRQACRNLAVNGLRLVGESLRVNEQNQRILLHYVPGTG
jgi:hypothetical protein